MMILKMFIQMCYSKSVITNSGGWDRGCREIVTSLGYIMSSRRPGVCTKTLSLKQNKEIITEKCDDIMSKEMIVTNQYLRCSNCVDHRFIYKSFKLFGKIHIKILTTIILNVRNEWFCKHCNIFTINMTIFYLHFPIISNIVYLCLSCIKTEEDEIDRELRTQIWFVFQLLKTRSCLLKVAIDLPRSSSPRS